MPSAFVSYSWDSDEHKQWVRKLAERLRADGVAVTLDTWATVPGDRLPAFMERAVRENDFAIIVCTPRYKRRSDSRKGGVGYEGDIMTAEVLATQNPRKFIPILRSGAWPKAAPSWLAGSYYIDLTGDMYSEQGYENLVRTLHGLHEEAPPLGVPMSTVTGYGHRPTAEPDKAAPRDSTGPQVSLGRLPPSERRAHIVSLCKRLSTDANTFAQDHLNNLWSSESPSTLDKATVFMQPVMEALSGSVNRFVEGAVQILTDSASEVKLITGHLITMFENPLRQGAAAATEIPVFISTVAGAALLTASLALEEWEVFAQISLPAYAKTGEPWMMSADFHHQTILHRSAYSTGMCVTKWLEQMPVLREFTTGGSRQVVDLIVQQNVLLGVCSKLRRVEYGPGFWWGFCFDGTRVERLLWTLAEDDGTVAALSSLCCMERANFRRAFRKEYLRECQREAYAQYGPTPASDKVLRRLT